MPKATLNARIVSLESVCESITDGKHGDCENEDGSGYYFLSAKDVRDGKLQYEGARQITRDDFLDTHNRTRLEPLDILISNSGTIGRIAIVQDVELTRRTTFQKSVAIIKPNKERVYPHYLLYYLLCARDRLINAAGGTAQVNLLLRDLRSFEITIYPLDMQKRIASILSAYDDLIENNACRIRILEQMAQAVYREWFGKVNPKSLPRGWAIKKLGDIAKEVRRNVQPDQIDPETPYFGLEHLPRRSIALSEWGKASEVQSTKLAFKEDEILFGKIRPYFHKVGVAPLDGVSSSDTIIISPNEPEYFGLVLSCVSSEDFVNHSSQSSKGTKMPRADWGVLVKYPVLVPPQDILNKHNGFIQNIVGMIKKLIFANRNLRQTRDLLLPRLVSGEIELSAS